MKVFIIIKRIFLCVPTYMSKIYVRTYTHIYSYLQYFFFHYFM